MKIFNFLKSPGMIVTTVAVISILAGAGTMAALAGTTYLTEPGENEIRYSSGDNISTARKQEFAQRKQEFAQRKMELAQRQQESALRKQERALRKREIAERKKLIDRHKHNSYQISEDGNIGLTRMHLYDFSRISASSAINIVFTQGVSDGYAEVHGDQKALDCIRFATHGGTLEIGYNKSPGNISTRTIVYITYPVLDGIYLSGASSLTVQGTLKTNNLQVSVSGASGVNIPHVIGETLNLDASGASNINVLSSEMSTIKSEATGASDIKLKGVCARTVSSCATGASGITVSGRCNRKETSEFSAGSVRDQGLIIENNRLDCNSSSGKKKTMPRKP